MSDREFMEQRHIDNARRWEEAVRSFKWQAKILLSIVLIVGAIFAGWVWYLYFTMDVSALRNTAVQIERDRHER